MIPPAPDRVATVPRAWRNDWSTVTVPDLAGWRPSLTVSVVIPAFGRSDTLDLVLAALSRQTYPDDLLEVIVVDDGSDPPLILPQIRPPRTTLVRMEGDAWGKPSAIRAGVASSQGEILHLLDSDMVVYPEHVAAVARWPHTLAYAVCLGHKRFVDPSVVGPWPSAEAVASAWSAGAAGDLFGGERGYPHAFVERYAAQTDQLRAADHLAFRVHVGATVAMRRALYDAAGGPDPALRFGNDTEHGYRLAQAGALFVIEPQARAWHLGPTHVQRQQDEVARYRMAFLADRVPIPRHWRKVGGTTWTVPLVEVVTAVGDEPLERVRAAVDSVLRGTERDVRVSLVGPWDRLDPGRVRPLADPQRELRLIAATYRGEPRVRLVTRAPESAFPSPYLLELPVAHGVVPDAVARLVALADREQVGVVRVVAADGGTAAVLWRTSARGRAGWVRADGEALLDAVASVSGKAEVPARSAGVVDLTGFAPDELASGITDLAGRTRLRGGVVPSVVEVEGVRSLLRAAVVVGKLGLRRARSWAGRRYGRGSDRMAAGRGPVADSAVSRRRHGGGTAR